MSAAGLLPGAAGATGWVPPLLGWLGLAVVALTGARWYQLIQRVAVPRNRAPYLLAFATGALMGIAAIAAGVGWPGRVAGGLAAIVGLAFVGLRTLSAQRRTPPAVKVGEPILRFRARDAEGNDFDLQELAGRPFLLKFFRGHW